MRRSRYLQAGAPGETGHASQCAWRIGASASMSPARFSTATICSTDVYKRQRQHNRCTRCGRPRAYYRKFGLCRVCLRELANKGELPGVTKASW